MNPLDVSPAEFRRLADRISSLAEQWFAELDSRPVAPDLPSGAVQASHAYGAAIMQREVDQRSAATEIGILAILPVEIRFVEARIGAKNRRQQIDNLRF